MIGMLERLCEIEENGHLPAIERLLVRVETRGDAPAILSALGRLLKACRAQGLEVNQGSGVAHGKNIPLLPILQIFRSYFGINEHDNDLATREKIAGKLLLIDAGFTDELALVFGTGVPLAPGETFTFRRYLAVGDGDMTSIRAEMLRRRGIAELRSIAGRVTLAGGGPGEGAAVDVWTCGGGQSDKHAGKTPVLMSLVVGLHTLNSVL